MALVAVVGVITAIWLLLLPAIGRQAGLREQIEFNRVHGLNAGAMFYTELEAMPAIRREMSQLLKDHPDSFWRTSGRSGDASTNDK